MWITTRCYAPQYLRKLIFEMYWDGAGRAVGARAAGRFLRRRTRNRRALVVAAAELHLRRPPRPERPVLAGDELLFPDALRHGARVQIVNEAEEPIENLFFYVDYELYEEGLPSRTSGRFHAAWNREIPCAKVEQTQPYENPAPWDLGGVNTTGDENYVILDTEGTGHYVGCVLNIDNFDASNQVYTWPGEGDDMIFIDGEAWPPSMHGTGTEDYFGMSWGFPSGEHSMPYHGVSLGSDVQEHFGKWSLYRFHIEDPVHFSKSIRVTIEHGHANDQGNDYSSVAYWYQTEAVAAKPLPPVAERLVRRWPEHGLWDR